MAATRKASKPEAHYTPNGSASEHCAICIHFLPTSSTCKKVAGPISPQGWSRFFKIRPEGYSPPDILPLTYSLLLSEF